MSINLSKDGKINLSKEFPGLKRIRICTNWDPAGAPPRKRIEETKPTSVPQKKKGFFSTLGSMLQGEARIGDVVNSAVDSGRAAVGDLLDEVNRPDRTRRDYGSSYHGPNIDIDTSVFLMEEINGADKFVKDEDLIYFGRPTHYSGAIHHMGDNTTGNDDGDEDDEVIIVDLERLPKNKSRLTVISNIFNCVSKNQHFGMIGNANVRIVDDETGKELCIYNMTENYDKMTGLYVADIYSKNGEWRIFARGEGSKATRIEELVRPYRR